MAKSSTSFTPTRQPGRPKGSKNKKTIAQKAFLKYNSSPIQGMILAKERLERILFPEVEIFKGEMEMAPDAKMLAQYLRICEALLPYESSKAPELQEVDITTNGESVSAPLTPVELERAKIAMEKRL